MSWDEMGRNGPQLRHIESARTSYVLLIYRIAASTGSKLVIIIIIIIIIDSQWNNRTTAPNGKPDTGRNCDINVLCFMERQTRVGPARSLALPAPPKPNPTTTAE